MSDKMVQNDVTSRAAPRRAASRHMRAPHAGGGGSSPANCFANISSKNGHFRAILKAPGKKKAKKGFSQKLEKKACRPMLDYR